MPQEPFTTFMCDACGEVIEQPEDGYLEWLTDLKPGKPSVPRIHGFKIVHTRPASPQGRDGIRRAAKQRSSGGELSGKNMLWLQVSELIGRHEGSAYLSTRLNAAAMACGAANRCMAYQEPVTPDRTA